MRRALRWIPAAAILALPLAASAQSASSAVSWGLIGGLNMSNIQDDRIEGRNMKLGFDVGLTLQKRINDMWSFNGEAHYSSKGVKTEESGNTVTLGLNYIEVPLLFRGGSSSGMAKPFIEFGVAPAFRMSCDLDVETSSTSAGDDCDSDEDLHTFDVGLVGGAGLEWTAMGRPWTLGARYNFGLTKISSADGDSGKNTNIQFLLGMRFR